MMKPSKLIVQRPMGGSPVIPVQRILTHLGLDAGKSPYYHQDNKDTRARLMVSYVEGAVVITRWEDDPQ